MSVLFVHRAAIVAVFVLSCATRSTPPPRPPVPAPQAHLEASPEPVPVPAPEREPDPVPVPDPPNAVAPRPPAPEPLRDPDVAAAQADSDAGKPARVVARLTKSSKRIERDASLDERVLGLALLARAQRDLGQHRRAATTYARVVSAWSDPKQAAREIAPGASDDAALRRLGRTLEAVGEALFFQAEAERAKVAALKPPAFVGAATDDGVKRHIQGKVGPFVRDKRQRIHTATEAYRKIIELEPLPPPRWVVAASARVGEMLDTFTTDFDELPLPPTLKNRPELSAAYQKALEDALEPQRRQTHAAFTLCHQLARRYQVKSEHSDRCDAWLGQHPRP